MVIWEQSPQRGPGQDRVPGRGHRVKPPEGKNVLAFRHPKERQICHILDILDKKLSCRRRTGRAAVSSDSCSWHTLKLTLEVCVMHNAAFYSPAHHW